MSEPRRDKYPRKAHKYGWRWANDDQNAVNRLYWVECRECAVLYCGEMNRDGYFGGQVAYGILSELPCDLHPSVGAGS